MITENIEIAVVNPDTAAAIGIRTLIERVFPDAVVRCFSDFGSLVDDTPDMYSFYFITSQFYVLYNKFFLPRKDRVVVLTNGQSSSVFPVYDRVLDVYSSESKMEETLRRIFYSNKSNIESVAELNDLSSREIEVLVLVAKGLINKEIADKLNISLTTVISHRKNITEKLGIKSVSGLTIYAVMNGFISPDSI